MHLVGDQKMRNRTNHHTHRTSAAVRIVCRWSYSVVILYFIICFPTVHHALANDSAVEVTPSGLQFKIQKDISMEKEELLVSTDKVEVTYRFKNQSKHDVVTKVGFPIPEYKWSPVGRSVTDFPDFTVDVDGKRLSYRQEVKALVKGKDYTSILNDMKISVKDFGRFQAGFYPGMPERFTEHLSASNRRRLVSLGILKPFDDKEPADLFPDWSVSILYYWTQRFPALGTITVKHSYRPYAGFQPFCASQDEDVEFLKREACVPEDFISWMKQNGDMGSDCPWGVWVSYILTTAKNWQGPIKDFNLVIKGRAGQEISSCFSPKLTRTAEGNYELHVKDYVPEKDLRVYFFSKTDEATRY
jgi:hypothetical protein